MEFEPHIKHHNDYEIKFKIHHRETDGKPWFDIEACCDTYLDCDATVWVHVDTEAEIPQAKRDAIKALASGYNDEDE